MSSFFLFIANLFLFHVALTYAIDVREMSIDEYINFVNPPPVYKYQNQFGETIRCVKFSDQISVKYSQDNITPGLKKAPKLNPPRINISNTDSGRANISRVRGVKSECPEDTVATREIKREDVERAGSVSQFLSRGRRRRNHVRPNADDPDDGHVHTSSCVSYNSAGDPIFGVAGSLNLWRPTVAPDAEFSLSQIWISNENQGILETIEAGWIVSPEHYEGSAEPHLFVYWTSDNYKNGCYDLDCPGYEAVDGAPIQPKTQLGPVSEYGGAQYDFALSLHLQEEQGTGLVWALYYDGTKIGHWPASLFNALAQGASELDVGGEVCHDSRPPGPMTATQMGSGYFHGEAFGHAAYTRAIQMLDQGGAEIDPFTQFVVEKPNCYGLAYVTSADPSWGKNIFFGGPGGIPTNPNCVA
eukprot:PITA_15323